MTESEWLGCTDPTPMLDLLRDKASDRKLRLFACACCRHAWSQVPQLIVAYEDEIEAIGVAERFADGLASQHDLLEVFLELERHGDTRDSPARFALEDRITQEVRTCASFAIYSVEDDGVDPATERSDQASLLRCIFGSPFRPVRIDPAWLTYNDGLVVKLAQAIYAERAFDRMSILADALEEAECQDADILGHCRQLGVHAKGCWVIDLLTGRS